MSPSVLVVNAGSSSLKYRLVEVDAGRTVASGLIEGIGEATSAVRHDGPRGRTRVTGAVGDHESALRMALDAFTEQGPDLAECDVRAVGHRVVHGGKRFSAPVLIDEEVEQAIEDLVPLAPLHNPPNLEGIRVARRVFPDLPQVAVFDTAFHQTLPPHAYTYAIPREWEHRYGVRRYGFHGTSHSYVVGEAAHLLGRHPEDVDVVVLHLGNGASATAVQGGRSVDTSMGMTPLQGLVMGSRSGDIDPAIPAHLERVAGLSLTDIDVALNRHSGMVGLAGDNDLRRVEDLAATGDAAASLALDVYCHRIRWYVGAYYAVLGRLDAIAFTAGVGENSSVVRARSLAGLEALGISVERSRNEAPSREARRVSPDGSPVSVLVIPTDEELEIARQTLALVDAR